MRLPGWLSKKTAAKTAKTATHLPAELQDEAQRFKVIFDNIDEGVVLIDTEGTIQMINPAAAALCGWKAEDAQGVVVSSVFNLVTDKGEPIDTAENPLQQVFITNQSQRKNDAILLNQAKEQVAVILHVTPLLGPDKQVIAAIAMLSNVNQERAEEKQRADFISTASHEMRTPVAAIEGYLALALNEKVSTIDARARDYLDKAHASTQHLGKLFQDLLTSAKAEDGRLTSHPGVLELGEFAENLVNDLRLVAEKKGLAMDFATSTATNNTVNATAQGGERVIRPLYYVYVDADRLREVITNLFDNAVKYTPEGKITFGLTGNDQVVQLYVRDTGPGIPADDLPHLFQKFYRVDNSATRTIGGTGLGLFICRKIIELYKGRIWAESELGKGSTFYMNLPRLSADKAREMEASSQSRPEPISTAVTP